MKIRPVAAKLMHADKQTFSQTDSRHVNANSRFLHFYGRV
jgi:hypothetical protein